MVLTAYEASQYFEAVWLWDNSAGAYVDNTFESQSSAGTSFPLWGQTTDYVYLGSESRFDMAAFMLESAGNVGARTWEYYSGSAWTRFTAGSAVWGRLGMDYDFVADGAETFDRLINWAPYAFTNSAPHSATPPDTRSRYWIRCSVASVAGSPTIKEIIKRPYASYCTPTEVASLLQLGLDFHASTIPTRNAVEDLIHNAQSYIDFRTRKSWRPNIVENEEHEFLRAGFQLKRTYASKVLRLEVYNGSTYDTKTQGRTEDYFLVPDTGMVYYARFFILPARIVAYGAASALWGHGFGEFTFPVRVSYLYGKNIFTDEREGGLVNDITRKQVAADIFTSHDYSLLAVSGSDRIGMDRKVDIWRTEVEEKIDLLQSWEVF